MAAPLTVTLDLAPIIQFGERAGPLFAKEWERAGAASAFAIQGAARKSMRDTARQAPTQRGITTRQGPLGKGRRTRARMHAASQIGNPPAIDSGNLAANIFADAKQRGDRILFITESRAPYSGFLENGNLNRPFLAPAMIASQGTIIKAFTAAVARIFRQLGGG